MKKKTILLVVLYAFLVAGCDRHRGIQELQNAYVTENVEDTIKKESAELTEVKETYVDYNEIEHEIVFVYQYTNWADGFLNFGYYIDKDGGKVEFDLSSNNEKYSDIKNLVPYLEGMELMEVENALTEEDMRQCYDWLCCINSKHSVEEICVAQDYGCERLYGIRYIEGKSIPEIIEIHEQGDWIRVNTDEYAQKLSDVDELIEKWDLEHFGYSKEEKRFIEE